VQHNIMLCFRVVVNGLVKNSVAQDMSWLDLLWRSA